MAGWKTDYSYTPNRLFKDYKLEISGSNLEVEETLQVPENGQAEGDWKYWASILPIVDHEGNQVSDTVEAEYWTVKSGFRETEIDATDSGDLVGTVTLTTSQTSVYEGGGVVYTLTRTGGPIGAGRSIGLKTWEPNRESDGSNPSEQTQYPHFPAWQTTINYTVSAYVDGVTEDGTDTLKAELVGNIFYMPGTPNSADVEMTTRRRQRLRHPGSGSGFDNRRADRHLHPHPHRRGHNPGTHGQPPGGRLGDYLRGNIWDPAPEIPTEATFEANDTTVTVSLTTPDDQRDLRAAGLITLKVLPRNGLPLGTVPDSPHPPPYPRPTTTISSSSAWTGVGLTPRTRRGRPGRAMHLAQEQAVEDTSARRARQRDSTTTKTTGISAFPTSLRSAGRSTSR